MLYWVLLGSLACSGGVKVSEDTSVPARPATSGPAETGDTAGDTADTDAVVIDCNKLPPPQKPTRLEAPSGYNDLVFDADGAMIGNDSHSLIRAASPTDSQVFSPNTGTIYKMGYLPNGDIVATASSRDIITITPEGVSSVLVSGLNGYGLSVGSDGLVYVGTNYDTNDTSGIYRIDPTNGDMELYIDASDYAPRALEFSADYSRLYFGTLNGGKVMVVDLDDNLDPIGEPKKLVVVPEGWHDTLEVDACGNVYVGAFFSWSIYRISAIDHSIVTLVSWNFNNYGHGFEWGDPSGGWDEMAIYITHPYNGTWVDEHVIGVPSRTYQGEVMGARTL